MIVNVTAVLELLSPGRLCSPNVGNCCGDPSRHFFFGLCHVPAWGRARLTRRTACGRRLPARRSTAPAPSPADRARKVRGSWCRPHPVDERLCRLLVSLESSVVQGSRGGMDGQRRRPQRTDHGDGEIGLANGASSHAPHFVRGTWGSGLSGLVRLRWEGQLGPGLNRLGSFPFQDSTAKVERAGRGATWVRWGRQNRGG